MVQGESRRVGRCLYRTGESESARSYLQHLDGRAEALSGRWSALRLRAFCESRFRLQPDVARKLSQVGGTAAHIRRASRTEEYIKDECTRGAGDVSGEV